SCRRGHGQGRTNSSPAAAIVILARESRPLRGSRGDRKAVPARRPLPQKRDRETGGAWVSMGGAPPADKTATRPTVAGRAGLRQAHTPPPKNEGRPPAVRRGQAASESPSVGSEIHAAHAAARRHSRWSLRFRLLGDHRLCGG